MAYIDINGTGTSLKDIIGRLGNKSYNYIECRCKYTEKDGTEEDIFVGCCKYNNETNELSSLDGEYYSLDDLYDQWEEWVAVPSRSFKGGEQCLTLWSFGILSNFVKTQKKKQKV